MANGKARIVNAIDTRTRLFYTAKFSDNLKFVNKFEMNATWGAKRSGYGQVGADNSTAHTTTFRVKNSYVDFKLGQQRFTVGVQDFTLARGYLFDDDASGVKAIFKVNDAIYLPLIYMKAYEGGIGKNTYAGNVCNSDFDVSAYVFYPTIFLNKDNTLKPHVAYLTSENVSACNGKECYSMHIRPRISTYLPEQPNWICGPPVWNMTARSIFSIWAQPVFFSLVM